MIFGYEEEKWLELGGGFTVKEIMQQPGLWRSTYQLVKDMEQEIHAFLEKKITKDTKLIFTGAGTSDYVGSVIWRHISDKVDARVEAVPTTDIVLNPQDFIEEDTNTVLVSFARSGNSPESVGAYRLFQKRAKHITHLVITCNKDGDLARMAGAEPGNCVIVLPDETNDKGFAMTSSFSCMLLAALLFFDIRHIDENKQVVDMISEQGEEILNTSWNVLKNLLDEKVKRIIYLGAGCFQGLAREMALKNLELTNGMIATMQESVLGFRHGPKAFMDDETLIFIMTSLEDYTNLYIKDLIKEIHHDRGQHKLAVLSYQDMEELKQECDVYITVNGKKVPEVYASLNYILFGQMAGVFNSIRMGVRPDNPSPDGTVNRVVKGVILHEI